MSARGGSIISAVRPAKAFMHLRPRRLSLDHLVGFTLPIPVFVQVTGDPRLVTGFGPSDGLPAIPIGVAATAVVWLIVLIHAHQIKELTKHCVGLLLLSGAMATVVALGLLATVFDVANSLLAAQWILSIPFAMYGALVVWDSSGRGRRLTSGCLAGSATALAYAGLAVLADLNRFLSLGRIDPIDPPLPGMYQVGNYTPLGFILTGCLLLALQRFSEPERSRLIVVMAIGSLSVGALLFGSRDALAVFALISACALVYALVRFRSVALALLTFAVFAIALLPQSRAPLQIPQLASIDRMVRTLSTSGAGSGGLLGVRSDIIQLRALDELQDNAFPLGQLLSPAAAGESGPRSRQSSHNSYLDLLVDFGLVGLLILPVLLWVYFSYAMRGLLSLRSFSAQGGQHVHPRYWLGAGVGGVCLVSANVNLPLVQPFTASLFYLLLGLLIAMTDLPRSTAGAPKPRAGY